MDHPHVEARQLAKAYGRKHVLEDLSFAVQPGDVVGLLGMNGAGKTTLLELILGFTPPTNGTVKIFGVDSFRLAGKAKSRIGFVAQQDELIGSLTARAQLQLIGSFYDQWDDSLLRRLSLEWDLDLDEPIRTMSVGQRQKLSILASLGHRPDLLVLDEPVASLDPVARRQFLQQIIEIAADGQRSVVFSSHIVSDVERLSNQIWILKDHRFLWQGSVDSLKESVVRVHIHARERMPETLQIPGALSVETKGSYSTAVMSQWTTETQQWIENRFAAELTMQPLSLEEILLELHR